MTAPFSTPENDDDLHLLMAVAVLCGQKGADVEVLPIFEAWALAYPNDALGPIGKGLHLIRAGDAVGGCKMIETAADQASTRAGQARDVIESLRRDVDQIAAEGAA